MIKKRIFREHNYSAFFNEESTLRFALDSTKPITKLEYPEFYDIAINNKCNANCPWCYVDAKSDGENFEYILDKIYTLFGNMNENQRPFSVAIGGHGEPTLHPDFCEFIWVLRSLGITPNYTTNGQHLTEEIIEYTKKYVGGVAVSTHDHLDWITPYQIFVGNNITPHLHMIISDNVSVHKLYDIAAAYKTHLVLLPYQTLGRAKPVESGFGFLFEMLKKHPLENISFGAGFLPHLKDKPWLNLSLYDEGLFSAYLKMDDMKVYNSSFDLTERVL